MTAHTVTPLVVAVSARSLFNLEESHSIFERDGIDAYVRHVRANEDEALPKGAAFPLVKALLDLNDLSPEGRVVEVIAVSSIHPDAGLRIVNSIDAYGLGIRRAAFTSGSPVLPILQAFDVDLLLSKSIVDVQQAVDSGMAAAIMYSPPDESASPLDGQIRIAFDGDAVIFSDESERIYKAEGLDAFLEHEARKAREPMAEGPFAKLLGTIQRIQKSAPAGRKPFRLALVTARGGNARERVLRTLRAWDIEIDEVYFLNGYRKDRILAAFRPHIFFDDQDAHVSPASKVVPSGRVPWRNEAA